MSSRQGPSDKKPDAAMLRETIRQIMEARSGPELIGASRMARALAQSPHLPAFEALLVRLAPDLPTPPRRGG